MLSLVYLVPAIWILQPIIIDPDIWWHLRTGQWIVDNGNLPATDPFAIHGEDKTWIVYSWLFDIGIYGLVNALGEKGILFYTLILSMLILLVVHKLLAVRIKSFAILCVILALCSIAFVKMFTPRPWLWTILGVALTLHVILGHRENKLPRWYPVLPLVYVIWANMHVQFVVGLGLLGLACLAPAVDQVIRSGSLQGIGRDTWKSQYWVQFVRLTIVCTLATLINPYHVQVYSVVLAYLSQTGFGDVIAEMQAPTFRLLADWAMLVLLGYALIVLGRQHSWSCFDIVLLSTAAYFSFRSQRDAWLLIMAAVAIIRSSESDKAGNYCSVTQTVQALPVIFSVGVGVLGISGCLGVSNHTIRENTARIYPAQAASFLEQQRYAGQLYNHFDWGGYLIWRLPQLKVSIDGRGHVYGDTRIKQVILAWNGGSHWKDDQDLDASQVVLGKKESALTAILRLDARFRVVFEDEVAVVFVRSEESVEHLPLQDSTLRSCQ